MVTASVRRSISEEKKKAERREKEILNKQKYATQLLFAIGTTLNNQILVCKVKERTNYIREKPQAGNMPRASPVGTILHHLGLEAYF